jgi:hypothetical protein
MKTKATAVMGALAAVAAVTAVLAPAPGARAIPRPSGTAS